MRKSSCNAKVKNILKCLGIGVLLFFVCVGVFLVFTAKWFLKTFGLLTIDEIVYHLKTSISGTNIDMIKDYILGYGLWAALTAFGVILFSVIMIRRAVKHRRWVCMALVVLGVFLISYAYHAIDVSIGVTDYLKEEIFSDPKNRPDFIAEHYVDSNQVRIEFPGGRKRNLIYIWLESMETTYADKANGGAFNVNVIPEMTVLAQTNEDFSADHTKLNGGNALPGANWTMGAMFAQTSGLPLKIPFTRHKLEEQSDFYPAISTLGDILEKNGYNQTLLLGSEAQFGGTQLYFSGHGNYQIKDYNWAVANGKIPKDYYEFWGYEDEKLYDFAKEELTELASKDAPFNLSMITIDTHFEDGYVCRLCQKDFGDDQYANVMACASRQLTSFIKWVQEQPFYENTTIVISGDHPTMDSDFCKDIPADYQRTTYTCILNSAVTRSDDTTTREYSTMDLFPTTLAAMGCTIDGDQLGLGVNLYSDKETMLEKYGLSVLKSKLTHTSELMNRLCGMGVNEEILEELSEIVKLEDTDESGLIKYTVRKLRRSIRMEAIERLYIRVTYVDPETSERVLKTYDCDLVLESPEDPGKYNGIVTTDIPYDMIDDVQAEVYISVGGFEDYCLGEC